ncbi:MAG: hydrogenase maturation protease [Nitrospira sp.]|nr:hydrogenase maturation protease [Nitrospira sp.]
MIKDRLLVIGLGNILMGDDGIGVHVINDLKRFNMAGNVDIVDGGTAGIDLLDILSLYQRVFVTDAIISTPKGKMGVSLFSVDDLLSRQGDSNYSIHDVDLTSTISLMKALDMTIPVITIIGIPASDISPGAGLSEECKSHLSEATQLLAAMIRLFYLYPEKLDAINDDDITNIMEELHDFL